MITTFLPPAFALLAALLYVVGVLSLKRAADLGVGVWHTSLLSNLLAALLFQGLLVFGGTWPPANQMWQPAVVALLFLSGQIWTFLSLQKGDVSVATPVLGLKIILVALFTTVLLGNVLNLSLWLAAGMATFGVALLSYSGTHRQGGRNGGTVGYAFLAAASLALFDVLVQKWSPQWGLGRFLPLSIGMVGLFSLALLPLCPAPLHHLNPPQRRWLATGSLVVSLQSLIFVSSIAYFQQATVSNVVYSSRGLWSVVAVYFLGHWFASSEQHLDPSVLRRRVAGAALMFAAIVLVLV